MFHVKHFSDDIQERLFLTFLSENSISFPENRLEKFFEYTSLVIEGNEEVNLVSKTDIPKFLTRHIADSLFPYIVLSKENVLKPGLIWADMGTGGGCPVFPLAIACPEVQFYASEPRHKRVLFLEKTKQALNLDNLTIVGKRFETSGISNCDIVSCRALSRFEADYERARPALKPNGLFITFKNKEIAKSLENIPNIHCVDYRLPLETLTYSLIIKGFYG